MKRLFEQDYFFRLGPVGIDDGLNLFFGLIAMAAGSALIMPSEAGARECPHDAQRRTPSSSP